MRVVTAIVFMALLTGVGACDDRSALPNSPSPPPTPGREPPSPPPAPAPPTGGLSAAVLVMSNMRVTEFPPRPNNLYYWYGVQFLLSEVSGKSGATITNVQTSITGDADNTGPICWRDVIRVAPSGTLDTFGEGWDALGYCAPGVGSPTPIPSLSVLVSYVDDEGRAGSVAASVTVVR